MFRTVEKDPEVSFLRQALAEANKRIDRMEVQYNKISRNLIPVGSVLCTATETPPDDRWLICDGRLLEIDHYPELFEAIQHLYSDENSLTHFRLPNLINRFIRVADKTIGEIGGKNEIVLAESHVPNHSHQIYPIQLQNHELDLSHSHQITVGPDHEAQRNVKDGTESKLKIAEGGHYHEFYTIKRNSEGKHMAYQFAFAGRSAREDDNRVRFPRNYDFDAFKDDHADGAIKCGEHSHAVTCENETITRSLEHPIIEPTQKPDARNPTPVETVPPFIALNWFILSRSF